MRAEKKQHQHGPNCNHGKVKTNTDHFQNLNQHEESFHIDDHSHEHDHGCSHSHIQDNSWFNDSVGVYMKALTQKPRETLETLSNGDPALAIAIVELTKLGPPPQDLKLPIGKHLQGFGFYFIEKGVIPTLLTLIKNNHPAKVTYMSCLLDLLYQVYLEKPKNFTINILDQFISCGGIEVLRGGSKYLGSEFLFSLDNNTRDVADAFMSLLKEQKVYLRLCKCGKREDKMDFFKVCAKCEYFFLNRFVPYCSRDCQVEDWKSHKVDCKEFLRVEKEQQHIHGPNCNHGDSHQHPVQQHVHGPNCNHSNPNHHHKVNQNHVHGPNCNHDNQYNSREKTKVNEHVHGPKCNH